jgi:methylmalonyl-CoA/ethylmalonyl-CoA epimerase
MAMQPAAGVRGIGQVALTVQDLERAKRFYRDVLGLRHLFDAAPGMAFFECGGVRLLLGLSESGAASPSTSTILYLDVADIAAAHAAISAGGAHFEQAPHHVADLGDRDLWLAFFGDSEGNMLALMSEVPKAGK